METSGLRPDAEQRIASLIHPDSIMPDGVTGEYWTVTLAGPVSMTVGVVIQIKVPYQALAWRVVPATLLAQFASPTILKQWQHQLIVLEEALSAKETASPYPNNIIYSDPLPFRYPEAQVALTELFQEFCGELLTETPSPSPSSERKGPPPKHRTKI
jgi:hypothetical protein